jgi:glutathione peroxidase-family protein
VCVRARLWSLGACVLECWPRHVTHLRCAPLLLLLAGAEGGALEWNYTKFLVDRQGRPVSRYKPAFTDFEADVSWAC